MGHNFDIISPGDGWFSSKLNKTYCSLVKFLLQIVWEWACFLASFSLRMGQFSNPVATHPRTNEVEVPPPPRVCLKQLNL